jgi:hypothetical protein
MPQCWRRRCVSHKRGDVRGHVQHGFLQVRNTGEAGCSDCVQKLSWLCACVSHSLIAANCEHASGGCITASSARPKLQEVLYDHARKDFKSAFAAEALHSDVLAACVLRMSMRCRRQQCATQLHFSTLPSGGVPSQIQAGDEGQAACATSARGCVARRAGLAVQASERLDLL